MGYILAPTVTVLPSGAAGSVVVTASHGGLYPGYLVLAARARAAIFNDAGFGKERAGVGALDLLAKNEIAAAAVAHTSCRVGDAEDMIAHGVISAVNSVAAACGVVQSMSCAEAASKLDLAPLSQSRYVNAVEERRSSFDISHQRRRVLLADSASLVEATDAGSIIVTGSHGGLVGRDPSKALRAEAYAAIFNDAGMGKDNAGTTRLPHLDDRCIAAVTVAASSARIGDARSTLMDGIVSCTNRTANAHGVRIGQAAYDVVAHWALQ